METQLKIQNFLGRRRIGNGGASPSLQSLDSEGIEIWLEIVPTKGSKGIDFFENYSPVVDDSSFCLILLLVAKLKLKAWSSAWGFRDEDIYMKIPDGFEKSQKPKRRGKLSPEVEKVPLWAGSSCQAVEQEV